MDEGKFPVVHQDRLKRLINQLQYNLDHPEKPPSLVFTEDAISCSVDGEVIEQMELVVLELMVALKIDSRYDLVTSLKKYVPKFCSHQ